MSALSHRLRSTPAALAALAVALGGCDWSSPGEFGSALVMVSCVSGCSAIASVDLTISPGDGSRFAPIHAALEEQAGQWVGRFNKIPAGPGRSFQAVAHDASGKVVASASGQSAIVEGGLAVVFLTLGQLPPVRGGPPVIDSLTATPESVPPGGLVQLTVSAHPLDPADTLFYRWSASCGVLDDTGSPRPRWTAPAAAGICDVTIAVDDAEGSSVSASLRLTVAGVAPGNASVNVAVALSPVILQLSASVQLGPTLQAALAVVANDPAGGSLTYDWSTDCPGLTFDFQVPPNAAAPHVTLPGPSDACAVLVNVRESSTPAERATVARLVLPMNQGFAPCPPAGCPPVAKDLPLGSLSGLAVGADGSTYLAGALLLPTVALDGLPLGSAGGSDVLLARYDSSGFAVWARTYGDSADQEPAGLAVTADETLAAIGQFAGSLTPALSNALPTPIDFLLGVRASDGTVKWGRSFNDGESGALLAIAANPALNRIAVCGRASQAATDLVAGAAFGGGSSDVVVALFDSAGNRLWSLQLGSSGDEECDAIALDDAGAVYAAGRYDAALSFTGQPLPAPATSGQHSIWLARFDGASGAPTAQAGFGGGDHTPTSLLLDAEGKLLLAGGMTGSLSFGGGAARLTAAGSSTDAFVARLDPAAAAPFAGLWAARLGGAGADQANGLAVDSAGAVTAVGSFNLTTSGAAALTAVSSSVPSAFVLRLDGNTGATLAGAALGNSTHPVIATQAAIDRWSAGASQNLLVYGGRFSGSLTLGTETLAAAAPADFLVFEKPAGATP